jgi:hypothetical protein
MQIVKGKNKVSAYYLADKYADTNQAATQFEPPLFVWKQLCMKLWKIRILTDKKAELEVIYYPKTKKGEVERNKNIQYATIMLKIIRP